jgi:hypothetical protein
VPDLTLGSTRGTKTGFLFFPIAAWAFGQKDAMDELACDIAQSPRTAWRLSMKMGLPVDG